MPRSILKTLSTFGLRSLHLLLPRVCSLCEEALVGDDEERSRLCAHCTSRLPGHQALRCPRCGLKWGDPGHRYPSDHAPLHRPPILPVAGEAPCPLETEQRFPWDSIVCWVDYAYPVDGWIHGLKFQRDASLAHGLGYGLARAMLRSGPSSIDLSAQVDAFVPIPLSAQRLAKRGFNQSLLIGQSLRRALQHELETRNPSGPRLAPLEPAWLLRAKHSEALSLLPMTQRQEHVQGAYQLGRKISVAGKRIGLIDDVMTTGATLAEATRCLKAAGASTVHAFIAMRTA
jgi:ComF family protein